MNYTDFGTWFFAGKLMACFMAFAIDLQGTRDSRILVVTYAVWIAFVFALTHTLLVDPLTGRHAPQILGYWWYLFQAVVALFPVLCASALKEAGARFAIIWLGLSICILDMVFFISATPWLIGHKLSGSLFFDAAASGETLQVIALLSLAKPGRQAARFLWGEITKKRRLPWMERLVMSRT